MKSPLNNPLAPGDLALIQVLKGLSREDLGGSDGIGIRIGVVRINNL